MKIDFDNVDQVTDYVTVPAGTYLCKIAEVQTGQTRSGDQRWGLRLVVAEGEFVGRQAAWDSLVFSERGMVRVQRVLSALGITAQGTVELQPEDLVELAAFVEVRPSEYQAPGSTTTIRRNEVPYDGFRRVLSGDQHHAGEVFGDGAARATDGGADGDGFSEDEASGGRIPGSRGEDASDDPQQPPPDSEPPKDWKALPF